MTSRVVRWAQILLIALAVTHVVIPAVMWWQRHGLHDQIARENPALPPAGVDGAVAVALIAAVFSVVSSRSSPMFHTVIPVVTAAEIVTVVLVWTAPARDFVKMRRSAAA